MTAIVGKKMKYSEYAVIVVGSGIAGLYSALTLSKRLKSDEKILLITKSPLGESNSRYAQGGIAGVLSQNQNDSVDLHVKDTLIAGAGLSDENIVKKISETSETVINNLISNGLIFDKDENGNFTYSLAGAHSIKRVLHCLNDATGKEIINTLINVIKNSRPELFHYIVPITIIKDTSFTMIYCIWY